MSYKFKIEGEENEYETVLEALRAANIFTIYGEVNGTFEIEEKCDGYFSLRISAEQLADLGRELIKLSEGKRAGLV